jgi:uncharacterized membrane protein YciS (DUF1049 family)
MQVAKAGKQLLMPYLQIIHYFKQKGYQFTTIANLMGKTENDVMPKLPRSRDSWITNINFLFAEGTYWGSHIIFTLFIVGIVLSIGRMVMMALLAWMQKRKENLAVQMPLAAAHRNTAGQHYCTCVQ